MWLSRGPQLGEEAGMEMRMNRARARFAVGLVENREVLNQTCTNLSHFSLLFLHGSQLMALRARFGGGRGSAEDWSVLLLLFSLQRRSQRCVSKALSAQGTFKS